MLLQSLRWKKDSQQVDLPIVEEEVVVNVVNTFAFAEQASSCYCHFADVRLKPRSSPFAWHRTACGVPRHTVTVATLWLLTLPLSACQLFSTTDNVMFRHIFGKTKQGMPENVGRWGSDDWMAEHEARRAKIYIIVGAGFLGRGSESLTTSLVVWGAL